MPRRYQITFTRVPKDAPSADFTAPASPDKTEWRPVWFNLKYADAKPHDMLAVVWELRAVPQGKPA